MAFCFLKKLISNIIILKLLFQGDMEIFKTKNLQMVKLLHSQVMEYRKFMLQLTMDSKIQIRVAIIFKTPQTI